MRAGAIGFLHSNPRESGVITICSADGKKFGREDKELSLGR